MRRASPQWPARATGSPLSI
jgi:hypothetical protein